LESAAAVRVVVIVVVGHAGGASSCGQLGAERGTVSKDGDGDGDNIDVGLGDPDDIALLVKLGVLGSDHGDGADADGEQSADCDVLHLECGGRR